jgi:hypothetical protein
MLVFSFCNSVALSFKITILATMLHNKLNTMKSQMKIFVLLVLMSGLVFLSGCDEDPEPENIPEEITRVVLTFTSAGAAPIEVEANDPDGDGPLDIVIEPISLVANREYTLTIQMFNGLLDPSDDEYNITTEIKEEDEEHQLFFGWSTGLFTSPTGTGNIGSAGVVNYEDFDEGGLPVGLETTWTTGAASSGEKTFQVILAHQPEIKSATSTSNDGEAEVDVTFSISINE